MRKKIRIINNQKGQAIIEFLFAMIIIMLMIYAMGKIFHWTGADLAARRVKHEEVLMSGSNPQQQIVTYFDAPLEMNAIWVEK
ncbi:MAG: hypothetical protein H6755_01520 [Candidatus Omnitrophica bacterium]|nr:hypothetical protein [Candidatus Omnitrophota bacterium]MCB9747071.1 hypothetical protein [Candidatus Omnitrophota bacterium]